MWGRGYKKGKVKKMDRGNWKQERQKIKEGKFEVRYAILAKYKATGVREE
jgi:phage tail tube protein FII